MDDGVAQRSGRISKPRNLRVRFNYKTVGTTGLQKIFTRNLNFDGPIWSFETIATTS